MLQTGVFHSTDKPTPPRRDPCPQMRFVVLNIDPKTNNVIEVGKYIDQHTCF
ncbi:hypothetical protein P834_06618 [Citrobacter freundii UCI 31]|nr:hypothetical protein P834_06618 [Citrobacter freundii UCI 31]